MSIRETLLGKAKKPLHVVEIDGVPYYFRHPTIGDQDRARIAGGVSQGKDGKSEIANLPRFQASLLMSLLVDEGNKPVFEPADMAVLCDAEIGGTIEQLMGEAGKLVNAAHGVAKNSSAPVDPA